MVLFNYSTKEITAKIVYYGPGLCGKTTNLQFIYNDLPSSIKKGKMLSLATKTDRTLFFDFLPLDLGTIRGLRTRLQLYTVPGQVFYDTTRKLVLKGADGVVFVADSQKRMLPSNIESLENLEKNLAAYDVNLSDLPLIIQFNKRDLPDAMSVAELNAAINRYNAPIYEAIATTGVGVHETLKACSRLVLNAMRSRFAQKPTQAPAPSEQLAATMAEQAPAPSQQLAATTAEQAAATPAAGKESEPPSPDPIVEETPEPTSPQPIAATADTHQTETVREASTPPLDLDVDLVPAPEEPPPADRLADGLGDFSSEWPTGEVPQPASDGQADAGGDAREDDDELLLEVVAEEEMGEGALVEDLLELAEEPDRGGEPAGSTPPVPLPGVETLPPLPGTQDEAENPPSSITAKNPFEQEPDIFDETPPAGGPERVHGAPAPAVPATGGEPSDSPASPPSARAAQQAADTSQPAASDDPFGEEPDFFDDLPSGGSTGMLDDAPTPPVAESSFGERPDSFAAPVSAGAADEMDTAPGAITVSRAEPIPGGSEYSLGQDTPPDDRASVLDPDTEENKASAQTGPTRSMPVAGSVEPRLAGQQQIKLPVSLCIGGQTIHLELKVSIEPILEGDQPMRKEQEVLP